MFILIKVVYIDDISGITSTHGVSWIKGQGVFNHAYPDVTDYTVGIKLTEFTEEEYVRKVNGVPADTFLLPPYAPLPVLEYAPTTIVSQTKRRAQWLEDIRVQQIANQRHQVLLPLNPR